MKRHPSTECEAVREVVDRVRKEGVNLDHVPFAQRTENGRRPDFEVAYHFEPDSSLGNMKLYQGLRCDFLYEGDDPASDGIHMIWPEFLDGNNEVIRDKSVEVPASGRALMWILDHESKAKYHHYRIKVGVKGFWVAGSFKIASVTVTKILGLHTNKE